jgi:hypothetical protein
VLRVLAVRIASRADQSKDPQHLIKDFSRVAEALAHPSHPDPVPVR